MVFHGNTNQRNIRRLLSLENDKVIEYFSIENYKIRPIDSQLFDLLLPLPVHPTYIGTSDYNDCDYYDEGYSENRVMWDKFFKDELWFLLFYSIANDNLS